MALFVFSCCRIHVHESVITKTPTPQTHTQAPEHGFTYSRTREHDKHQPAPLSVGKKKGVVVV
ncbi:Uncharacterised protein [Corynebacterium diphtheriae]|nr:Uncharacterised protein [Corynebacterium diphtheriae]STC68221.1 Uncharacterised protein [Corynebacterium diphtheriae]